MTHRFWDLRTNQRMQIMMMPPAVGLCVVGLIYAMLIDVICMLVDAHGHCMPLIC
jgi:hypothetical protein